MAQAQILGSKKNKAYSLSDRYEAFVKVVEGVVISEKCANKKGKRKQVSLNYKCVQSLQKNVTQINDILMRPGNIAEQIKYHANSKYISVLRTICMPACIGLETISSKGEKMHEHCISLSEAEWRTFSELLDQLLHDLEILYQQRRTYCDLAGADSKVKLFKWIYVSPSGFPAEESQIFFFKKQHAIQDGLKKIEGSTEKQFEIITVEHNGPALFSLMKHVFIYSMLCAMELLVFEKEGKIEPDCDSSQVFYREDGQRQETEFFLTDSIEKYINSVKRLVVSQNFLKTIFTKCLLAMQIKKFKYFSPDELVGEVCQRRLGNMEMLKKEIYFAQRDPHCVHYIALIREVFCQMKGCIDYENVCVNEEKLWEMNCQTLLVASPSPSE